MSIDRQQLKQILEGALLAVGQPMTLDKMQSLFDEETEVVPAKDELRAALQELAEACEGRGFELVEVASGWRFQVRQAMSPWVNRLWEEKPQKYSRALLETLALIAYRQPITRGDIEEIRGVAVSSHIIKTLTEREWVKVVGHRDVPGRPSLYATTRQFLDYFNLKSLDELPTLSEIADIASLDKELDLEGGEAASPNDAAPLVASLAGAKVDASMFAPAPIVAAKMGVGADTVTEDAAPSEQSETETVQEAEAINPAAADDAPLIEVEGSEAVSFEQALAEETGELEATEEEETDEVESIEEDASVASTEILDQDQNEEVVESTASNSLFNS